MCYAEHGGLVREDVEEEGADWVQGHWEGDGPGG
jgi:hypothetical protein